MTRPVPDCSSLHPDRRLTSLLLAAALVLTSYLPLTALAQARAELNSLIFDAVLLPAQQSEAAPLVPAPDAEPPASDLVPETLALHEQIQRYRDSIRSLTESSDSPYSESEALREQNYALALLLQQNGEYEAAVGVLEAAMHIDRVNYGLFTSRQIDLVNQLIQNHEALGHYDKVGDLEEYLYYIQTKSYPAGDPRLIAATSRWADWNVESFLKSGPSGRFGRALSFNSSSNYDVSYVAIQNPNGGMVYYVPRDKLPFLLNSNGFGGAAVGDFSMRSSPYAMTADMLVDERLKQAEKLYEGLLEDNADLSQEQRTILRHKLANTAFATKRQMDAMITVSEPGSFGLLPARGSNPVVTRAYIDNTKSLETLAQTLADDPRATPTAKAQAYLDLGDWHLGFDRFRNAEQAYHRAWELLGAPATEAPALHPVLNPQYLLPVPGFVQHPYSRELYGLDPDTPLQYQGYLDVSLELDHYGGVRRAKIIGTSTEASQVLRSALLDYLRDNRMRPFLQNGEAVDVKDLNLRFYYHY